MKAIAIAVFLSRFCLVCLVFSEMTFFGISWKPDEVCLGHMEGRVRIMVLLLQFAYIRKSILQMRASTPGITRI